MPEPLAELSDVAVERNGVRLLGIPFLRIESGKHCVVFGPNGSGKSTLLKLLMRFHYPSVLEQSTGTVKLFGQEDWNVWELRKKLGFVSSEIDFHFTSGRSGRLTPLQAVLTGFDSSELETTEQQNTPERIEAAQRWLRFFELDPSSVKHVAWLSTGERRRVMLARAMVLNPQALLLDEPTAGLDLLSRSRLLTRLSAMAEQGIQLLLVTHHLEEVIPQLERVVMLKCGAIFSDMPKRESFRSEHLSKLFDAPVLAEEHATGWHARLG
ncbi:putative ABC transporter ATP-binding protein YlmA [Pirellula sp. SH-Sr6A]|uniref:ABC transporter ATP-binding protein n=1 Tax=Pirellula sp. SH-Sr6A TaxID=1632865 RepID=UPI00078D3D41|nr:ATP-binding cassette domain-containing protein [Pirellula sp. SH-Sr6A]AMV34523.1 putative ABC transporter ATP-binding protein YlmA [Pirellula sp. SH-Sr6A]